jgi:hypothetical protein
MSGASGKSALLLGDVTADGQLGASGQGCRESFSITGTQLLRLHYG